MIGLLGVTPFDSSLFAFDWLFAFDVNLVGIIIFIVVAVLSAISQYVNKQKEDAARQRRRTEQAKRELAMQEDGQRKEPHRQFGRLPEQHSKPAAAPVDENVATEIRDFLERAATGRPAGQAPGQPKPIPPIVVAPTKDSHRPLASQPVQRTSIDQRPTPTSYQAPQTTRPAEAKVVSKRQLTSQDRRQSEILRAQKQAEAKQRQTAAARFKQKGSTKFDRNIGSLKKQAGRQKAESTAAVLPDTMATDIAAMFADTNNIRQAIVINEILTRPVHRWE